METCNDDILRSHRSKPLCHHQEFVLCHLAVCRIRQIEKLTRLRKVRRHDIGVRQELTHLCTKCGCIRGIKPAVIPHHRVDDDQCIPAFETMHRIQYYLNLFLRAKESRKDCIKIETVLRPVLHIGAHMRCIVIKIVLGKARMYGKNCRGERACLDAHRGDQRKLHRHRTASKSCHIIDEGNPFLPRRQRLSTRSGTQSC